VAGTSQLRFGSFAAYAWPGGLLWVSTFLTLGYYLGENWQRVFETIHHYILYFSIAVLAIAAGYYWFARRKREAVKMN
jgi:membrane protein DedA with SNARE-associated domain